MEFSGKYAQNALGELPVPRLGTGSSSLSIGKLLEAIRKQGFQVAYLALVNSLLLSAKWPIYTIEMAYFPKLLDALNVAFACLTSQFIDVVHLFRLV